MDLTITSGKTPTHLTDLHTEDESVVEINNSIVVPILVVPYLLKASGTPPGVPMVNDDISIMGMKGLFSTEDHEHNCTVCSEKLDLSLLADEDMDIDDLEEISCIMVSDSGKSNGLTLCPDCSENMINEAQHIIEEHPEDVMAASI